MTRFSCIILLQVCDVFLLIEMFANVKLHWHHHMFTLLHVCVTDEWAAPVLNRKESAKSFSEQDDVYTKGSDPFVFANGLNMKVSLLNFLNFPKIFSNWTPPLNSLRVFQVQSYDWPDGPSTLKELFNWPKWNADRLIQSDLQHLVRRCLGENLLCDITVNDAYSGMGTGGYTLHLQHAHLCRDFVAVVLFQCFYSNMLLASSRRFAIRNDDEWLWLCPTTRIWQGYDSHNLRYRSTLSESVEELAPGMDMKNRIFDTDLALHHQRHSGVTVHRKTTETETVPVHSYSQKGESPHTHCRRTDLITLAMGSRTESRWRFWMNCDKYEPKPWKNLNPQSVIFLVSFFKGCELWICETNEMLLDITCLALVPGCQFQSTSCTVRLHGGWHTTRASQLASRIWRNAVWSLHANPDTWPEQLSLATTLFCLQHPQVPSGFVAECWWFNCHLVHVHLVHVHVNVNVTVMFNDPNPQDCLTPAGFAKASTWSAESDESDDSPARHKHRRKIRFATAGSTCVDHSAIGSLFLI